MKFVPAALLAGLLLLLAAAPAASAAGGRCDGRVLLPDLVAGPPPFVLAKQVENETGVHNLVEFGSNIFNFGRGDFKIVAKRRGARSRMKATQLVRCRAGRETPAGSPGKMRYVRLKTHQHWHLMDIERYTLRALDGTVLDRATKRGFCLGDSLDPKLAMQGKRPVARFNSDPLTACGARRPGLRRIVEGISVGYGDYYAPFVEGQFLELDGLPEGQYRVINELDPDNRVHEAERFNNVAGFDFILHWEDGVARTELAGSCEGRRACATHKPIPHAKNIRQPGFVTSGLSAADEIQGR